MHPFFKPKRSLTASPEATPYQRAGQVWDDRMGLSLAHARNWRRMALANLGLAAFLGAGCERFDGTVAALAYFGLAGEVAAAEAAGPGSFAVRFLDALAAIDPDGLDAGARIEVLAG